MDFYKRALELREETVTHRRWLHSNAEVGLNMPKGQACHVGSGRMPVGLFMYNSGGTMMYSVDGFRITIHGKGAQYHS